MSLTPPDDHALTEQLVAALEDPAAVVDAEGRILAVNGAAQVFLEITGPRDPVNGGERFPLASGGPLGGATLVVWAQAGRPDELDLERQRARLVARIAPGVAHDVANSLAGVSGFAGLLRDDPMVVAEYGDETLALLESGGQGAMTLVRTFTNLAREGRPGTEAVDVAALLADVLRLVNHRLVDIRSTVDVPSDLPEVEASRAGLLQGLTAIVLNGLEALGTPRPSGALAISARQVAHGGASVVELSFEDDAPTVPPGDRPHLFDARPPTGCTPRAGLDLAAARQLLEADGGTLRYEEGTDGRNRLVATLTPAGGPYDREPPQRG